ncbi:unnamed protein product, partial [Symbiodinium sp. CCMP2456]
MAGCGCDECARKKAMLEALSFAGETPLSAELRQDLDRHSRRVELASATAGDVASRCLQTSAARAWLSYDPDVLLPTPFDAFLLSGHCEEVEWPEALRPMEEVNICFILGCGRSGSTIFAEILSHYRSLIFLNEPRQLWIPAAPSFDVWSTAAPRRGGSLSAGDPSALAQVLAHHYRRIAALVRKESQEPVWILEKFPEHAFRVDFLRELCEQGLGPSRARFLHLRRDGLAVAR